jgi:hypothetical protein
MEISMLNVAFGAGVVFGSLLLLSVCIVWLRKQAFGVGGGVMCLCGVTLIGLTVWRTVQFKVGEDGVSFEAQLNELTRRVDDVGESVATIAGSNAELERNVASLNTSVVNNSLQFRALADSLTQQRPIPADRAAAIRDSIVTPQLDSNAFETRAKRLERLQAQ